MQVSNINDVKIYNLSCGKSLPEWLSDRKKRALQKKDVDVRRRIELIQDFEMPTVSTNIKVSRDGQYIMAAGTYKPRIRCYDTYQLSLKFERCLDADVVKFDILSEDYSKIVFLQSDRYVEFHSQHGRYYRLRIPKFGRDFSYHYPSCDLYFVGGKVECWDPRIRTRVGMLDCALNSVTEDTEIEGLPSVSALKFNGSLQMAVGTSTGQVLLYDLRSSRPMIVKDHQYGLPIRSIQFHNSLELIITADSRIIKMWNKDNGKIFTSIEPEADVNDVCLYPNSGMLFTANETPKMNVYYIPALGPAPRWCSFLDNLTEELEENPETTVYDDYKFVTKKDLEDLGLAHLIGSPMLRAYMHGYFIDIRLYHKVKAMVNPFAYEEYRREKIRQKIEETRAQRVQIKKLPKVNKELALKLLEEEEDEQPLQKRKQKKMTNILSDDRFKVMFENPDFQVDEKSEEYRLLNPLVSKISQKRKKKLKEMAELESKGQEEEEEPEGKPSDAESSESSDDEKAWVEEVRKQRRLLRQEEKTKRQEREKEDQQTALQPQFYEIKAGEEFRSFQDAAKKQKLMSKTIESLIGLNEARNGFYTVTDTTLPNNMLRQTSERSEQQKKRQEAEKQHKEERKKLRRSAGHLRSKPAKGRPFY
ncbi:nucleolar protein 10 [Pyxicephalus adspersus]|uniref:nucleolar protein 10 n=1 Tax=Pyxicephalus adspersus TaxID=30357 RepID=UPI003B5A0B46